ncbi:copper resistance CopC family protein [Microbacterium hibisci]|uniref:copper resistance CopC family protein n=1 Tax=Microbacterium hibisci TaxID=2036000 RepID=UPI0019436A03|nr:copper resistance CopC family protein [Microbacterium hibisci]
MEALGTRLARPLRALALVAAFLLALAGLLAWSAPAHAHDELIGSDPAAGSTAASLPAQLTLTFSGEIADDEGASVVEVTDAGGTALTGGTPTVRDNVLTQPLAGEASGAVKVLWKVVSSDGHPISGEFSFTVEGAPAPTPTETSTPTPTETAAPTETASPEPTPTVTDSVPSDSADTASGAVWPWVVFGIIGLGVVGAVVYLLVSRSRREKALAGDPSSPAPGAPRPGSEPPADH